MIAGALAAALFTLALQRAHELRLSARHEAALRARGGVERGRRHFPLLVGLHLLWPLALIAEVAWGGARPGRFWPAWLALALAAQLLRHAAIHALGERWTVRVWVLPGAPPLHRGIYRWLRHPNYLAVALELIAIPLLFGAWRTAVAATLGNAVALAIRIPVEERALRQTAPTAPPPPPDGDAARWPQAKARAPGSRAG